LLSKAILNKSQRSSSEAVALPIIDFRRKFDKVLTFLDANISRSRDEDILIGNGNFSATAGTKASIAGQDVKWWHILVFLGQKFGIYY